MMHSIEKRLQSLEARAKHPVISTLADLVKWCAEHGGASEDAEIELSPELQTLVDESLKCVEEEIICL